MINFLKYTSILLVFTLISVSCKSKKGIMKQATAVVDTTVEKCRMDFKTGKALSKRMNDSELNFTYASAKFSCDLTIDTEEHSFNVSVRCRKDSVIWLSISKLGIDAARVLITKDTVKFTMGLTEKKYFVGDFSYINQMLHADLDYDMLQALLFGNSAAFHDDDDKLKPGRDRNTCQYFLSTVRKRHLKKITNGTETPNESYQTIWLDPSTFKILTLEFDDIKAKRKFNSSYNDFRPVDKYLAPFKLLYSITAEKNIKADISYSRISINEQQSFPFKIPPSYERIQFKQ
ncbi:MAG TPA: DUF4292 domain-containing protein [Bacteroidia bacterium]|jgi:hypothetical protein|nr:DUF4292 domain-containing protein [Bacteroidia bacterium]